MSASLQLNIDHVREAARFLDGQVVRTPTLRSAALDRIIGAEVWLKAECMQHIGAFKARGALHTVGRLSDADRARGIVTYSSGNHAQAVAWAARQHGIAAAVAMPTDAPRVKVESVQALGASVTFAGTTSSERKVAALAIAAETGAVVIPPFDHPHIVTGQGTATLELFEDVMTATGGETLDALVVPVGGGGVIAGACLVAATHGTQVYSVEPYGCDAMGASLEAGERVAVEPGPTLADGLKPVRVGELNFSIAQAAGVKPLRVNDEEIGRALITVLAYARALVEPSGAAGVAAAIRGLAGGPRRVGIMLTGGNVGMDTVSELLSRYSLHPVRW